METIEMERNHMSYGSRIAPFSGRTKKRRAEATSAAPGFSDKRGPSLCGTFTLKGTSGYPAKPYVSFFGFISASNSYVTFF